MISAREDIARALAGRAFSAFVTEWSVYGRTLQEGRSKTLVLDLARTLPNEPAWAVAVAPDDLSGALHLPADLTVRLTPYAIAHGAAAAVSLEDWRHLQSLLDDGRIALRSERDAIVLGRDGQRVLELPLKVVDGALWVTTYYRWTDTPTGSKLRKKLARGELLRDARDAFDLSELRGPGDGTSRYR